MPLDLAASSSGNAPRAAVLRPAYNTTPPPFVRYGVSSEIAASLVGASQKNTTSCPCTTWLVTPAARTRSMRTSGARPMASARSRNSVSSADASSGSTSATRSTSSRGTTNANLSSAASASESSVTIPSTAPSGDATGSKVTTVSPSATSETVCVPASRPLRVNVAFTVRDFPNSRDNTRALTASIDRSRSLTRRASTARIVLFAREVGAMPTARNVTPAGRSRPATPVAPARCRSEMSTISAAADGASSSICLAVRNAGANRVPRTVGFALPRTAVAALWSSVSRCATSAASSKNTTPTRSRAASDRMTARAESRAAGQISVCPMLSERSSAMTTARVRVSLLAAACRLNTGRAKARTSRATASARNNSSGQSVTRRRCDVRIGSCSRNISDGKRYGRSLSLCRRWISSGMTSATSPARKAGTRNPRPMFNRLSAPECATGAHRDRRGARDPAVR